MTNLLITILKHLSTNDTGYPFFKNMFQEFKFFMKPSPIGANFKTSVTYSVYQTDFVIRWQKTIKMAIHTTKGRFPINCCGDTLRYISL